MLDQYRYWPCRAEPASDAYAWARRLCGRRGNISGASCVAQRRATPSKAVSCARRAAWRGAGARRRRAGTARAGHSQPPCFQRPRRREEILTRERPRRPVHARGLNKIRIFVSRPSRMDSVLKNPCKAVLPKIFPLRALLQAEMFAVISPPSARKSLRSTHYVTSVRRASLNTEPGYVSVSLIVRDLNVRDTVRRPRRRLRVDTTDTRDTPARCVICTEVMTSSSNTTNTLHVTIKGVSQDVDLSGDTTGTHCRVA